jgi:hypothetical protein
LADLQESSVHERIVLPMKFMTTLIVVLLSHQAGFASAKKPFLFSQPPHKIKVESSDTRLFERDLETYLNEGFYIPSADSKLAQKIRKDLRLRNNTRVTSYGLTGAQYQQVVLLLKDDQYRTDITENFLSTLSSYKKKIMELYEVTNTEYNKLSMMAFAIMGRESSFGLGLRYNVKSSCNWCVRIARFMNEGTSNSLMGEVSKGLTQIKVVPDKITERFKITNDDLGNPKFAAIATLGFLIESMQELKKRIQSSKNSEEFTLHYITDNNMYDYIPYIYTGRIRKLYDTEKPPEPENLNYNHELKEYLNLILILEAPENSPSS